MLVTDKEIYKINRKRKREYSAYEPTIEESNEYKSKRLKPINYDSVNKNRKIWNENEQIEYEQAIDNIDKQESTKMMIIWTLIIQNITYNWWKKILYP